MPIKDHVNVQLLVDGDPLYEYRDPGNKSIEPGVKQCFVEVKAGQEFMIRFTWMAGFKLHFAPYVYCEARFDDDDSFEYSWVDCKNFHHQRGSLLQDNVEYFKSTTLRDQSTGHWLDVPFVFGALGTNDEPLEKGVTPSDFKNLGSIRIKCFRAKRVLRETPYISTGSQQEPLDEIPEKALKGKDIKTNVKYGPGQRLPGYQPPVEYYSYEPVNKRYGNVLDFRFFYRTRKTLQNMGCIPRSPSPQPDKEVTIQRLEDMLQEKKQLIAQLQIQNGQDRPKSAAVVKSERKTPAASVSRGVKRERVGYDDELSEIAPPAQRPRIEIDLTGDE